MNIYSDTTYSTPELQSLMADMAETSKRIADGIQKLTEISLAGPSESPPASKQPGGSFPLPSRLSNR